MSDPFLEREKELKKLNESLNTKMTFDLKHQAKATANSKMKKVRTVTATTAAAAAKSIKCDQINHAKLSSKGTFKLKTDNCEIIKKPISNAYTSIERFIGGVKRHELGVKDIAFNCNSSNSNGNSTAVDSHTMCDESIKQTMMCDGDGDSGGGCDDGDDNKKQRNHNEKHSDHGLIETIEKAIDTNVVSNTAAHLSLIPANVYRKNVSTDGIIKYCLN